MTSPLFVPLTAEELDALEAEELAHRRALRPLDADWERNCEGCEERPAVAAMTWIDTDGNDHEPYLCQPCIDRDFLDLRLIALIRGLQAAAGPADRQSEPAPAATVHTFLRGVIDPNRCAWSLARNGRLPRCGQPADASIHHPQRTHPFWPNPHDNTCSGTHNGARCGLFADHPLHRET